MSRISDALYVARSALAVQRYGLQITGHNIANANTEGYTRQRVVAEATRPLETPYGMLGTGVQVAEIERVRDRFLDEQVRTASGDLGRWAQAEQALAEVEGVFAEPSDGGLNSILREFWDSWRSLADHPESLSARQIVLGRAGTLVEALRRLDRQLKDMQYNMNTLVDSRVEEVNRIIEQIARLNVQILNIESRGSQANDDRDRRDLLLDRLSRLVDVQVVEGQDVMVSVFLNGRPLVEGKEVSRLAAIPEAEGGRPTEKVVWESDSREVGISGGELGGVLEVRDDKIKSYMETLDKLARTLAREVNSVHRAGYTLEGATGVDFFRSGVEGAGDIDLSDAVKGNPSNIAASKDGHPGDGSNALAIADLEYERAIEGFTLDDYYRSLISQLGQDLQEAQFMRDNHELLLERFRNERESAIGVSLDEEMVQLIQYQHAYVAAARLTLVLDRMIQATLDMVG
ncbi:MAG TPA: flagellar hook-associated protein FlgK [Candidatus Latescibacteria bacterium]|nr:flagellar hook-associated protein FlgK [Candidatus Latescibacterota bacterium]